MRQQIIRTRPMTAWLIVWESAGNHAAVDNPYVDIVSMRKSVRYIQDYVQRLHDTKCLSFSERVSTAKYSKPARPPYETIVVQSRHGTEIHCGHNPYLVAKPVRNLVVEVNPDTGEEMLSWSPYIL